MTNEEGLRPPLTPEQRHGLQTLAEYLETVPLWAGDGANLRALLDENEALRRREDGWKRESEALNERLLHLRDLYRDGTRSAAYAYEHAAELVRALAAEATREEPDHG